jgi:hypothetical protein
MVTKDNISIDAGGVLFLRFVRVKTSEEQSLSIFPDVDFVTFPILFLAMATITQGAPCGAIVSNLPAHHSIPITDFGPETALIDIIDNPLSARLDEGPSVASKSAPTIHSHVNRILDRVSVVAGVDEKLTSHSFRRGGAQHANASELLTARWIFDRGAWNISATNKGFNYVFNTSKEDHKIAKVLSGRSTTEPVPLLTLESLNSGSIERIRGVQKRLFASSFGLKTMPSTSTNVSWTH